MRIVPTTPTRHCRQTYKPDRLSLWFEMHCRKRDTVLYRSLLTFHFRSGALFFCFLWVSVHNLEQGIKVPLFLLKCFRLHRRSGSCAAPEIHPRIGILLKWAFLFALKIDAVHFLLHRCRCGMLSAWNLSASGQSWIAYPVCTGIIAAGRANPFFVSE